MQGIRYWDNVVNEQARSGSVAGAREAAKA